LVYEPFEPAAGDIQQVALHAYAGGGGAEVANVPQNSTVDATEWSSDSKTINLAVTQLRAAGQTEILPPWNCAYDVTTHQLRGAEELNNVEENGATEDIDTEGPEDGVALDALAQPGERFPATRLQDLSVPDVSEASLDDIRYALNEMFARHGFDFGDVELKQQFANAPWYQPRPGVSQQQIIDEFTPRERANLEVLARCRDLKTPPAHKRSKVVRGQRVPEATDPITRWLRKHVPNN
jgi:hypothetical protein